MWRPDGLTWRPSVRAPSNVDRSVAQLQCGSHEHQRNVVQQDSTALFPGCFQCFLEPKTRSPHSIHQFISFTHALLLSFAHPKEETTSLAFIPFIVCHFPTKTILSIHALLASINRGHNPHPNNSSLTFSFLIWGPYWAPRMLLIMKSYTYGRVHELLLFM